MKTVPFLLAFSSLHTYSHVCWPGPDDINELTHMAPQSKEHLWSECANEFCFQGQVVVEPENPTFRSFCIDKTENFLGCDRSSLCNTNVIVSMCSNCQEVSRPSHSSFSSLHPESWHFSLQLRYSFSAGAARVFIWCMDKGSCVPCHKYMSKAEISSVLATQMGNDNSLQKVPRGL